MIKYSLFIFLIFHSLAFSKEISLTFDDAPRYATGYLSGELRAKILIENLKKYKSGPVVFFSVTNQLSNEGVKRLLRYSNEGHIIANHTNTHPNFNKTSLNDYKNDFLNAHEKLSSYKTFQKLFRFPYLREGNTKTKLEGMRKILNIHGYKNAYITSNNYDWYIEQLFQKAISVNTKFNFDKMRIFYVNIMMESINYYDQMAIKYLGRSPKHVLLLHELDISALFIGDLIKKLRANGWSIISAKDAYKDEISNYKTTAITNLS